MNKLFSKIAALSVGLTMAVGVGVALGSKKAEVVKADDPVAYTLTYASTGNNGYAGSGNATIDGVEWTVEGNGTMDPWRLGGKSLNEVDRRVFSTGAVSSENISKVVLTVGTASSITVNSLTLKVGTSAGGSETSTVSGTFVASSDITFNRPTDADWSNKYFTFTFNVSVTGSSNRFVQFTSAVFYYESSAKTMGIRNNSYASGPFEVTFGDTSEYKYALAYDAETEESIKSGVSWTVSDESIIDYTVDSWTWLAYKPKAIGTTTITASLEGYNDVSTTITVVPGTLQSLAISGSMTKTSYYVGEPWSPAGFSVSATYDSGYVGDVTSDVAWTYSPSAPATSVTSVVATASLGSQSASSSAQTVSVSKTNPIQVLYTLSSGASVDVYGVYVGFLDGTGPVIMDGAYGMVVYDKSAVVSSYTVGETILHVTGEISIYKGLYEIGSATISEATSVPEESVPETPVVYATKGGETADYASRLTTVTGVPTVTSGSFDSDAGTADIKMNFVVGGNNIQVFYKKAAQIADAEAFAAAKAAVEGSSEITIKGFTGWYDGFQVQMNGYVKPAEDYTAEDFAQDLLDQTDAVCTGWEEGVDNHDALEAIWSNLASNDKYPSLPSAQKTILAEAARDESGTVVERAMARYDFLTGKYNLSNFINGRTPVEVMRFGYNELTNDNTMVIVVVIAAVSALAFTTLLVFKKKKQK